MRPARDLTTEVIIVGGGLAGLTLACCLGAKNIKVICLEQAAPLKLITDSRTTAIAAGPKAVLESCGVWPHLAAGACPIEFIRIADQDSRHTLDFDHKEIGTEPFGYIVDNAELHAGLMQRLEGLKDKVTVLSPAAMQTMERTHETARVNLTDGRIINGQLIIGADGRRSPCRELAGIETYGWDYQQTALVCTIHHEIPHQNIAVEHFLAEGPLATLPMTDDVMGRHRSSVVWTVSRETANYLTRLTPTDFSAALQPLVQGWCGGIDLQSYQAWPLNLRHARRYTAERLALINEAAHGIHPVAGQGLNLGMRDIAKLTELLAEATSLGLDLGQSLGDYEASRRQDNTQMILATDLLVRLFSNNLLPLKKLRQWGLSLVQLNGLAGRFFMRSAMGA